MTHEQEIKIRDIINVLILSSGGDINKNINTKMSFTNELKEVLNENLEFKPNAMCKGSLTLGTGCGECIRCSKQGKEIAQKLLDITRKRSTEEKPKKDEVVLALVKCTSIKDAWYFITAEWSKNRDMWIPQPPFELGLSDYVDSWWPISHLVGD